MSNIALQKPASVKKDIRTLLGSDAVKSQLALVLPKHMTPDRMARVALTALIKTPKLLDCTNESLLQALMLCSQAGLEPDGRNAHLIPYGTTVQVIFDYKGLVALAERNGVENIYADKVCENDEFQAWVEDGIKRLNHKIDWKKPRGKAYAYYASCRRSGRLDYEVMTMDEVEAIRKRSRAANAGPWVTDFDEMAKKTPLRRMSKRWDLSSEVAEIINADDDTPADVNRPKRPAFGEDPFAVSLPESTGEDAGTQKPANKAPGTTEKPQGDKTTPKAETKPSEPANGVKTPETPKTEEKQGDDGDLGPESKKSEEKKPEEKAPEKQNVEIPEGAVKISLELASFKKSAGESDDDAYMRVLGLTKLLCTTSSVTEAQLLAWGVKNKMAKAGQKLGDLNASKFIMIGKSWNTILPDVRKETA